MSSHLFLALIVAVIAAATVTAEYREKVRRVPGDKHNHGHEHGHDHGHGPHELQERTFTTFLDHFNPRNIETFEFNYVQNVDYYRVGGPLYIFVNDGDLYTTEFLQTGLMHDIAHDTGAALITADNRFFRSNLPTQNASTVNLQHLTVEQSISDIARLIEAARGDLEGANDSRVILWGTGFGASLATWTKQKFPHLVSAVWSSSGAYEHVVHSQDIYEQLSANIERIGGADCAGNLTEAFHQISTLTVQRQTARLANAFGLCYDIQYFSTFDVAAFFSGITQILIDHINVHHATGIENFCAALSQQNDEQSDPQFEAYARWVQSVFTDEFCLDLSIASRANEVAQSDWEFIEELAWTDEGVSLAYPVPSRPALYLRCTQLGMWATSVNADSLFEHKIGQDVFFRFCEAAFGEEYEFTKLAGAVANLNVQFGGSRPAVNDVLYTNGELDPHYGFGVQDVSGVRSVVLNIANHAKSADLFSVSAADRPELAEAKQRIIETVTAWSA